MADISIVDVSSYTYVSDCHNATSWLDHIVINNNLLNVVSGMLLNMMSYLVTIDRLHLNLLLLLLITTVVSMVA